MSGVSFFSGAKGVVINGGTFSAVHGDYHSTDQSRRITNINSFNSNNTTTLNSHNDNSAISYGPGVRNRNPRRGQQIHGKSDGTHGNEEVASYFPPPTMHPMMLAQQAEQAYAQGPMNVSNVDSFNIKNQRTDNSNNDNSERYGSPAPRFAHGKGRGYRAHGKVSEEAVDHDPQTPGGQEADLLARGGQRSASRAIQNTVQSQLRQAVSDQSYVDANGTRVLSTSTAQYHPHEVQTITDPRFQQTMAQLMDLVRQQTSQLNSGDGAHAPPSHNQQSNDEQPEEEMDDEGRMEDEEVEDDNDDDDGEAECSDTDDENVRMTDLPTGMSNLSLNEDRCSATSSVNSSARIPPTVPVNPARPFPDHPTGSGQSRSSQDNPSRQSPVASAPTVPPAHQPPLFNPMQYGQQRPFSGSSVPPRANHPTLRTTFDKSTFDFGGAIINGNPVVNIVHGVYEHVDRSSHIVNVGSGNVTNTLIKDSNNDNSIQNSTFAPGSARRKLGRDLRRY